MSEPRRVQVSGVDEGAIVPDVYIHKVGDDYVISKRDGLPKLKISPYYSQILKTAGRFRMTRRIYSGKLRSAQWLKERLSETRTIFRWSMYSQVSERISDNGLSLRPMILRDGTRHWYHESTVSRVTSIRADLARDIRVEVFFPTVCQPRTEATSLPV